MEEANKDGQPEEQVMLQIIMRVDGQMRVVGPLVSDEVACYGILEKAKQMVAQLHNKPQILKPQGNFLAGLRGNGVGKH